MVEDIKTQVQRAVRMAEEKGIDYSDIPELTPEQAKRARKVWVDGQLVILGPKEITIRVYPAVFEYVKDQEKKRGVDHRTLISRVLYDYVEAHTPKKPRP